MEVYYVRHTAVAAPAGTMYGRTDVALAETFEEEAAAVLAKVPSGPDLVVTSPLSRCRRLAERIAPSPEEDARLVELDFGRWEMLPWRDIPREEIGPWYADYVNQSCPGGERFADLIARAREFWEELRAREAGTAVVVTHGGVVRGTLVHLLGMPGNRAFTLNVDFGGVTRIDCGTRGDLVSYVNR